MSHNPRISGQCLLGSHYMNLEVERHESFSLPIDALDRTTGGLVSIGTVIV